MARGSLSDFFVWGGGGAQLTPDEIAQRRKVEAAILARGVDTSPIGHWTQGAARVADAIAGAFRRGQLEEDATANNQYNSDIVNSLLGSPSSATSTPASSAATSGVSQELAATSPAPVVAEGEIADYIRQSASARGIDPDVALRVAMSEGGLKDPVRQSEVVKNGVREASYGPFQLYMGGGLGNKALEAGIDPRDPNQWKQGVDFALDQAAKGGWSPWYGAAKVGIGNRTGLDNARAIGFAPRSAPTPAAAAIETAAPESGYVDPVVSTPNAMPSAPVSSFDAGRFGEGAPVSAMPEVYSAHTDFAPPLPAPTTINPAPPVASVPQQVAQAQPQTNPAAIAQALRVMADPRANEGTRAVANALIQQEQRKQAAAQEQAVWMQRQQYEQQQQANDPLHQAQILQAQAQAQKLQRDVANPNGDESFYGNPVAIQNPDGTLSYGQIGNRGTFKPITLGEGQQFAPPTRTVDAGTETILTDQAGNVISRIPKQNREAAAQTAAGAVEGKTTAERGLSASADYQSAQNALDILTQIEKNPALESGTGFSSVFNRIPGSSGYDFQNLVEQAKSGAFLTAIESLRGMGSLSNAEGGAATAAVTRMDTATSKEAFEAALSDYRKIVTQGLDRAKRNMPEGQKPPEQPTQAKRLRYNPATGELE